MTAVGKDLLVVVAIFCFQIPFLKGEVDPELYDTLSDYEDYKDRFSQNNEQRFYDNDLETSRGPPRIRTSKEQRFLDALIMEAGRHVLFPPKESSNPSILQEATAEGPSYYERKGQPEFIDLDMQRTGRSPESYSGPECPQNCPDFKPVCSNEGKVYNSECHLVKANCGLSNVTVSEWENCRGRHYLCPSNCLDINDPVCGKDGRIYHNICVMRRRNCGKLFDVQAIKYCYSRGRESKVYGPCPEDCQEIYKPTCGSDGVIYYNECFLKMRTCGKDIEAVELERCAEVPKCPEACIPLYDPVCASDGKLYINHCRMLQNNCGNDVKKVPRRFCASIGKGSGIGE